jgi:hypothetical protein
MKINQCRIIASDFRVERRICSAIQSLNSVKEFELLFLTDNLAIRETRAKRKEISRGEEKILWKQGEYYEMLKNMTGAC